MNEHRIWKMCRLALFEQEDGKKDLEVVSYYKRDYVALGLLANLFEITIAYLIIAAVIVLSRLEYLTDNFAEIRYSELIAKFIIGYLLVLGLYSVLIFTIRRVKYARARRRVREHYISLNELYEETEKSRPDEHKFPEE